MEKQLNGTGITSEAVTAQAYKFSHNHYEVPKYRISEVEKELDRLDKALQDVHEDLTSIYNQMLAGEGKPHADIVNAHLMILSDETFLNELQIQVTKYQYNAEYSLNMLARHYVQTLEPVDDPRFRERTEDLLSVIGHVLRRLMHGKDDSQSESEETGVVVARTLSPSDTAFPGIESALGWITETGGMTSPPAILARALEIPAVVGVPDVYDMINDGDTVILDCSSNLVIIDPTPETLLRYGCKVSGELRITDPLGLHVRPAALLAECASRFDCEIYIRYTGQSINAKSTIGLLTLNAPFGSRLKVTCDGTDASVALKALQKLTL